MSKIISKYIIIKSFSFIEDNIKINVDNDTNNYIIQVNDGTAQVKIKKSDGTYTGLQYLEEDDIIKIKGHMISNIIIIQKINIDIKYQFNSESSDDLNIF